MPEPTFASTADARDFRSRHDQQAIRLNRMRRVELRALLDRQDRADGFQRLSGGPSTKDELMRELLERDFPLPRLNESIHVLHHEPGQPWDTCPWCEQETRNA